MGKIEIDHTGSGSGITLSSDGSDLLLDGTAIGGGGVEPVTVLSQAGSYTILTDDLGKVLVQTTNGAYQLPTATAAGSGWFVTIHNLGNTQLTINRSSPDTVNNGATSFSLAIGASVTFVSDGISKWFVKDRAPYFYAEQNANTSAPKPVASGLSSMAIGRDAQATAQTALALGTNSGFGGSRAAGSSAMALGGSYASGTNSFAAAIANNSSSYGATGANSVAIGGLSKASSTRAVSIGYNAVASSTSAVALGGFSATASEPYSFASGYNALANKQGKFSYSGQAGNWGLGFSQMGIMVLYGDTADATPEALTANNSTPNALNQIILPNNSAYAFHGTIVARQQASQGTACAAWKVEGLIRREGSAGTTVLVNSTTTVLDNTPSWGMALSADTTNGGLKIEVTGAASTNIRWVATINTSEVTY